MLVLGARGAVGAAAIAALADLGIPALRAGRTGGPGIVAIDVTTVDGLADLAALVREVSVVIDATGLELAAVQDAVGETALVDVSASAPHLERLAARVPEGGAVVLGAGIAPGISTILARALGALAGDSIDIGVMLGGGEAHGAAAVEWTARLAGTVVYAAPEERPVTNLRGRRRLPIDTRSSRTHLRADFPDDLLIGAATGVQVRSWLAMDTVTATAALGLVGAVPRLGPLLKRAPHLGGSGWRVSATHRESRRTLSAAGIGQSAATGLMAALAAQRIAVRDRRGGVTMADLLDLDDLRTLPGILIEEHSASDDSSIANAMR
ncbi:hypothetical protein GCM10025738_12090 [Microbacterium fluvii]